MKTKIWTKETIRKELKSNVLEVVFEKTDGSERTMKCTLMEEHLPSFENTKQPGEVPKQLNDNVIAVYDLDSSAWRSFRISSIKDVVHLA